MSQGIDIEPALPETLEILLRGNLHRKSLRAGIAAELYKAHPPLPTCDGCKFWDDLTATSQCRLHGRASLPKNYCSWHETRE